MSALPLGYVGGSVPLDLLLATGRPVSHLSWDCHRETPEADQWLESGFAGWLRCIVQDWAEGRFNHLGHVVFTRGSDAVQRAYYYVCELQRMGLLRGPQPLLFDLALIPRESSLQHTLASLRQLASQLDVDDEALRRGVIAANRLRTQALAELAAKDVVARPRVLLAGSVPPDQRLHRAIQDGGAQVVADWHELAAATLGPPIDATQPDLWTALARHCHSATLGPRVFGDGAQRLVDAARAVRADAVLLWLTRDDEALAWHVPAQRAALQAAGLPSLVLTVQPWLSDEPVLQAVREFAGELT